MGKNSRIDAFATLTGKVKIGADCHVGVGVGIFGVYGFEAGDRVGISPGVQIFTSTADPSLDCLAYHKEASFEAKAFSGPVRVANNAVIGSNSVVLPCAAIGDSCVIGANSTVKGPLMAGLIYAGNPAKAIRAREPLKYGREEE